MYTGGEAVLPRVVRASGFLAGIYTGGPGSSQPWRSTWCRATAGVSHSGHYKGWSLASRRPLEGRTGDGRWLGRGRGIKVSHSLLTAGKTTLSSPGSPGSHETVFHSQDHVKHLVPFMCHIHNRFNQHVYHRLPWGFAYSESVEL